VSYILDALKKSDQERKQGDVPTLQTVHIPVTVEQKKPLNLYVFIGLLLLVLSFAIGVIVSEKNDEKAHQQPAVQSSGEVEHATITQNVASPHVEVKKEAEKAQPAVVAKAEVLHQEKPVKRIIAPAPAAAKLPAELVDIPYLHELPDYMQQSIPDLSFAGHIYSSNASNRSVIINGRSMSEGDSVMLGLDVSRITSSGVVFSYQDSFFRVDILQDWSFE